MPYAKLIPVRPEAVTAIAHYLGDADHPNHAEYEILPLQMIGAKNLEDFLARTQANFDRNKNRRGRRGKPKNAAAWFIVRTPDGTALSPDERRRYEEAVSDEAGNGAKITGVMTWHQNKLLGCEDLNLLAAAFDDLGHLVRDKTRDPILRLRKRMDQVTDKINELRKEREEVPIQTMEEAQQIHRDLRGDIDIVAELARLTKPPRKAEELEPALLLIDCTVTRYSEELDYIRIKKPKKKKATTFTISKLLADIEIHIEQMGKQKKPAPAKQEEIPSPEIDLMTMLPPPPKCKDKDKDKEGPTK